MTTQHHNTPFVPDCPTWILVTPAIAKEWLKVNSINRKVRAATVKYMAEQIRLGRFEKISQGIGFRWDGVLVDGQHRLLAIIMADIPAYLLVVPDLSDEAFTFIDRGNNKSASDVLHLPPMLLSDASLCHRITVATAGRISEIDQRDIATWWVPAHDALAKGAKHPHGLSGASIRVGCGARWAIQTSAKMRDHIASQYKAMMAGDLDAMTKATAALWKRFCRHEVAKGSVAERIHAAALSFYYSDPVRTNVAPLVRDVSAEREELRKVIAAMEDAYTAAPLGAAHPYLFPSEITQTRIAPIRPRPRSINKAMDELPGLHIS